MTYLNYRNFSLEFDATTATFNCLYKPAGSTGEQIFIRDCQISLTTNNQQADFSSFRQVRHEIFNVANTKIGLWHYSDSSLNIPDTTIRFKLTGTELGIDMSSRARLHVSGFFNWGNNPETSVFSVKLDSTDNTLQSTLGPATRESDNALFDRATDRVLKYNSSGTFKVSFDWSAKSYRFDYADGDDYGRDFSFRVQENYCQDKFQIPYVPIDKTHGFTTPPIGWMTWYATQFTTCEKVVLENAALLQKIYGKWADKLCVWVDWEWCHDGWSALGIPGVDVFTPRADVYPNGLAPVAAAIKKLGLIPALWVAPSNDGRLIDAWQQHPDWVLGEKKEWCGRFWIDPTHPEVLAKFIPAVFRQVLDWGYSMIKWDCIPATLTACDYLHDKLYDKSLSTEGAVRQIVQTARQTVGSDVYMLSCSGDCDREVGFAMDCFSAARIGGDVFAWDKFVHSALGRVYHCYTWHNVTLYADADNIILREEFNTMAQARSRVSFYGLAGLPVTLGDDLRELPEERADLLRCLMPTADIHPSELQHKRCNDQVSMQNLAVCRNFASWNVVALINLTADTIQIAPHLTRDFALPQYKYAVYDFWAEQFLGVFSQTISVDIAAFDCAVLRITPLTDVPTIIYTGRHITQGAVELGQVNWNDGVLSGRALAVVVDVRWVMAVYVPDNYQFLEARADAAVQTNIKNNILTVSLLSGSATEINWQLHFSKL